MNYLSMVRNAPNKNEGIMWESVQSVSEMLDKMAAMHPEIARSFMMKEYGRMYGRHFNEELAKDTVAAMWHESEDGSRVEGEAVTYDEAKVLLEGKDDAVGMDWDAYVGANGFVHDLAKSGLPKGDILELAKVFWFWDDDFNGDDKVFWYYSNK